jgi:hypothetical protein
MSPARYVRAALAAVSVLYVAWTAPAARGSGNSTDPSGGIYTVFLGLDLTLKQGAADCPVVAVAGGNFEILADGQTLRLPIKDGKFKTAFSPRVGRRRLDLTHVRTRRTISTGNDPAWDGMAQQVMLQSLEAQAKEATEIQARELEAQAQFAHAQEARGIDANAAGVEKQLAEARGNLDAAYSSTSFASVVQGANLTADPDEGVGGLFDSYRVDFEISAPIAVDDAYGVLRVIVRDPINPRHPTPFIKFFELRPLETKPRRVTVVVPNLPQGFAVEGYAVHIFAKGRELPTTVSKNQVEVSATEAHQFLVLQYLQHHHQDNLPVAIIPDMLPPELPALIAGDQTQPHATVDLAIDHDGRVTAVQQTSGIATTLSPELEAALREVRFLPALVNGNPVDGRGTFALSEFIR